MLKSGESPLAALATNLETRGSFSFEDRQALLALPHSVKPLRRHEFIVREDEISLSCCVLLSGFAMRHKVAGNGGRQIFSIHMRGDAVDLNNSLLGRADHNVQMLSSGEAAFIAIDMLRDLLRQRPLIAEALWRDTLVQAAIFREWTLNVGRRDARSRMAHMLCEFALRLEQANLGQASDYELPMTQGELSDALSLTPIHVSRTLKALAAEGLVERSDRYVRIIDWHRMAKLGDFDSNYLHLPTTA